VARAVLVVGAAIVVFPFFGISLVDAFPAVYRGTIQNPFALSQVMTIGAVLTLAGMAALVPFRAGFVNLGGEGQVTVGAVAAAGAVLSIGGDGSVLVAALALAAGTLSGALWAGVSSLLCEAFGANQVITTLMFTYISFALADFVRTSVWPDATAPQTRAVPDGTALPGLGAYGAAPAAIVLASVWWLSMVLLFAKTNFGFRIRAAGENESAAGRFGFRPVQTRVLAMLIGGGMAGFAGGLLVLVLNRALTPAVAANYGYVGLAAALVAGLRPGLVPLGAGMFALMTVGGGTLGAVARVSPDVSLVCVSAAVLVFLATQSTRTGREA
jgi:simple sugar transport system permease protein